jgi:hypothetical protein
MSGWSFSSCACYLILSIIYSPDYLATLSFVEVRYNAIVVGRFVSKFVDSFNLSFLPPTAVLMRFGVVVS